jgi:cbb3-type cytochrome c oxidase subunit III
MSVCHFPSEPRTQRSGVRGGSCRLLRSKTRCVRGSDCPAKSRQILGACLLALALSGCGKPNLADEPQPPDAVMNPQRLFADHCAACHGAEGRGGPAPPLNDPLFLARISADDMEMVVSMGREHTMMPAFSRELQGELKEDQIKLLVKYIREEWGKDPEKYKDAPPYELGDLKKADPKEGKKIFAVACASCHGDNGEGRDVGALNDPAFLALVSDQLLRRIIITGRPDFGMPDYRSRGDRKPLTSRQIDDVVAYVASWRQDYLEQSKKKTSTSSRTEGK